MARLEQVHIYMESELRKRVQKLAKADRRSVSSFISLVLLREFGTPVVVRAEPAPRQHEWPVPDLASPVQPKPAGAVSRPAPAVPIVEEDPVFRTAEEREFWNMYGWAMPDTWWARLGFENEGDALSSGYEAPAVADPVAEALKVAAELARGSPAGEVSDG